MARTAMNKATKSKHTFGIPKGNNYFHMRKVVCGLTLEKASELSGFSLSTIMRWEAGISEPLPDYASLYFQRVVRPNVGRAHGYALTFAYNLKHPDVFQRASRPWVNLGGKRKTNTKAA